jgi:hypothetical protein
LVKDMIRQASERAFLPSNRPRFVGAHEREWERSERGSRQLAVAS